MYIRVQQNIHDVALFSNVVIFGSLLDPVIQFKRESQPKNQHTTKKYYIRTRKSTWMGWYYVLITPCRAAELGVLLLVHKDAQYVLCCHAIPR